MPHPHAPRIQVVHAAAPTCFWSWGYEAVFNRLRLVYGDQIDLRVLISCVYTDFEEYLKHYELTFPELVTWTEEARDLMGVPLHTDLRREMFPPSQLPASLAVMAAFRQGEPKGVRFFRALLRRSCVEGQDVTRDDVLLAAAREAGLDETAFRRDYEDRGAREEDLARMGSEWRHLPVGFYNVAVTDGDRRTVILDYAFDPREIEEAVDYLSGGTLKKQRPEDVLGYLREHGPTPLVEIARVFALSPEEAQGRLAELEGEGRAIRTTLAHAPHWQATGDSVR